MLSHRFLLLQGLLFFCIPLFAQVGIAAAGSAASSSPSRSSRVSAGGGADQKLVIDRIEIVGVHAFPLAIIEGESVLSVGEVLADAKVVKTLNRFQNYYQQHGYRKARFQSFLNLEKTAGGSGREQVILKFQITEGEPDQLLSVDFSWSDADQGAAAQALETQFRAQISVKPGDPLDQLAIEKSQRQILEVLASNQYMGSQVKKVETVMAAAAGGVRLTFQVDRGEFVIFGFRGNQALSQSFLKNLIQEMRVLGLGHDYLPSIEARIRSEYKDLGFVNVKIAVRTFEGGAAGKKPRQVSFLIDEGLQVRIADITFDGNSHFSQAELKAWFLEQAPALIQNGIYSEKKLESATANLMTLLQSRGYLFARLMAIHPEWLEGQGASGDAELLAKKLLQVKLVIYLYEGEPTEVESFRLSGATVLEKAAVQDLLKVTVGAGFNLFAFTAGLASLKAHYYQQGYFDLRIVNEASEGAGEVSSPSDSQGAAQELANGLGVVASEAAPPPLVSYTQDNRKVQIQLTLVEGQPFVLSRIEVQGLVLTQESVLRRELVLQVGDVILEEKRAQSERQIKRLGIFSETSFQLLPDPDVPQGKILHIQVKEGERGLISGGPGIRSDLGIRGFGAVGYTNIWGLAHSVTVSASANRRFAQYHSGEGQAQLQYQWPWFLGSPGLIFRPSLLGGKTQYTTFSAVSAAASLTFERMLLAEPSLVATLSYSFEVFSQETISGKSYPPISARVGAVTPKLTLDLRNDPLSPSSGAYFITWIDLAPSFLGSSLPLGAASQELNFYRAYLRGDYYWSLLKDLILSVSYRAGYERGKNIPAIKLFALGGIASVRGYQELSINYSTLSPASQQNVSLLPEGSFAFSNYRVQLDIPFSGALRLAAFVDAAQVTLNDTALSGLFFGAGLGFHYQTPIGPVNLEVGIPVRPPSYNPAYPVPQGPVFHFSIGVI